MYHEGAEANTGLAVLQAYVRNQGDGWTHASNHLQRLLAFL